LQSVLLIQIHSNGSLAISSLFIMTNSIKNHLLFAIAIEEGNLEIARDLVRKECGTGGSHPSSFPHFMREKKIASEGLIHLAWEVVNPMI